jgi:hypothetical protein
VSKEGIILDQHLEASLGRNEGTGFVKKCGAECVTQVEEDSSG